MLFDNASRVLVVAQPDELRMSKIIDLSVLQVLIESTNLTPPLTSLIFEFRSPRYLKSTASLVRSKPRRIGLSKSS